MLRKIASIKDLSLCLLSAFLLILSFPVYNLWICAWFAFVPVFFALQGKSLKQAFFLFLFTGIIFWAGMIYWLIHVTLAGTSVLIIYLALYFAVFGLLIRASTKHSSLYSLFFIPATWVLLEYVRGQLFTGFPWALLGYSQQFNLPVIQIADITGASGVSFLLMLANVSIVEAIWAQKNKLRGRLKSTLAIFFSALALSLGYGYSRISGINDAIHSGPIRVSVVQGNIPQELKWDKRYSETTLDQYLLLSSLAAKQKPQVIIWPEAAVPGILGEDDWVYEKIYAFAKENKIPLLVGAVVKDKGNYYGSALSISPLGQITGRYDKLHRVPFGEYIPLRETFPFLQTVVPIGDIQKGSNYTIFADSLAVLDCFEDVFPELARQFIKRGARLLVNITNDAWYKDTSAPWQHLQASVFRAVENRVCLARAANTGISGFISPCGEIVSLVRDDSGKATFIAGIDTEDLFLPSWEQSFYTRYGDVFTVFCLVIMVLHYILARIRKKHV